MASLKPTTASVGSIKLNSLRVRRKSSVGIGASVYVAGQKGFALRNVRCEVLQDVKKKTAALEALEQFKISADRE
jgi:hypothetical protein